MKIVVAGSSGLVGSALVAALRPEGHEVRRLVRREVRAPDEIFWKPALAELNAEDLERADAIVHLGGEGIADARWTAARKEAIVRSRVESTRLLVARMARLSHPPRVFVCASAVGYYGDRGDERLTESSEHGEGFLAETCRAWEEEAKIALSAGIRVVRLRFGMVLSPAGGALARLLPVFRRGFGGRLGDGRQWVSWITLADAVGAIRCVLDDAACAGALNVVSPHPVRNAEFTALLAAQLGRRTGLAVPVFMLKAVYGEMAGELLLSSQRAQPEKLGQIGYAFQQAELEGALRELLE